MQAGTYDGRFEDVDSTFDKRLRLICCSIACTPPCDWIKAVARRRAGAREGGWADNEEGIGPKSIKSPELERWGEVIVVLLIGREEKNPANVGLSFFVGLTLGNFSQSEWVVFCATVVSLSSEVCPKPNCRKRFKEPALGLRSALISFLSGELKTPELRLFESVVGVVSTEAAEPARTKAFSQLVWLPKPVAGSNWYPADNNLAALSFTREAKLKNEIEQKRSHPETNQEWDMMVIYSLWAHPCNNPNIMAHHVCITVWCDGNFLSILDFTEIGTCSIAVVVDCKSMKQ